MNRLLFHLLVWGQLILASVTVASPHTFSNTIDGYSVEFPAIPKEETEDFLGAKMVSATYETNAFRLSSLSYKMPDILYKNIHMSKDPNYAIKYQTERQIKRRPDERHEVRYFSQNGWPASDLTFYPTASRAEIIRTVMKEDKLIMCVAVLKNSAGSGQPNDTVAQSFLNSLKVEDVDEASVQMYDATEIPRIKEDSPFSNPWTRNGAIVIAVVAIGFLYDILKKKRKQPTRNNEEA